MYRLLSRGVLRLADGLVVLPHMIEWADYRAWLKAGGAVLPEDPPVVATPSLDEVRAQLTLAVQAYLDRTAKERGYDGILSCSTYTTSTNVQFAAEGQACVSWRDAVWVACYAIMADVLAGNRPVPTEGELIAELPVMAWPG